MTDCPIPSPKALRDKVARLGERRHLLRAERESRVARLRAVTDVLNISGSVADALDKLSEDLFGRLVTAVERQLTYALREVLDQPIELKVDRDFLHGAVSLSFHVERPGGGGGDDGAGLREDVMRGQGGSVANILSVGLRLFALTTLDEREHRRFLVLDVQDCWLHPSLVPRRVKFVHEAGKALGFQVLMISHHDASSFERYADKVYRLTPTPDGVKADVATRA
jgi:hypothetical protein